MQEWPKLKKIVTTANTAENVEKLDHSYIAAGNVKGYNPSGKVCQFFAKLTIELPSTYHEPAVTFWGIYLREMKTMLRSHKNLYTNVHSSFICNIPHPESTPRPSTVSG